MTEAECIIQKLNRTARYLVRRGYGIAQLVFSDLSFVSVTAWAPDALTEVKMLLRQGERPLGFIARLSERRGQPFVEPWERGDLAALVTLNDMARFWYHHRMLRESEYQEDSNNGDGQKTRKTQ